MAKRGRPRHPDVLTPREWEVLALVREGLTNEQIGARLGITERTAKYHVSEILSKLGLRDRQEAAAWSAEGGRRPWWATAVAPLGHFARKLSPGWLSPAVAGGLALVVAAGVGALVWGVLVTGGDSSQLIAERLPAQDNSQVAGTNALVGCALDSTGRFLDAEQQATFPVYCPSFLPAGFELTNLNYDVSKYPRDSAAPPGSGMVFAVFSSPSTGARLRISQGQLGNDLFPQWKTYPPPLSMPLRLANEIEATFYPAYVEPGVGTQPAVIRGLSPSGKQMVLDAEGLDTDTMTAIGQGMIRVSPKSP
jgi:DNA-binding CsgD family transcriptional regulator